MGNRWSGELRVLPCSRYVPAKHLQYRSHRNEPPARLPLHRPICREQNLEELELTGLCWQFPTRSEQCQDLQQRIRASDLEVLILTPYALHTAASIQEIKFKYICTLYIYKYL